MKRTVLYLLLAAGFLTLTAEDCFLEEKSVEVPVSDAEVKTFHTKGTTQKMDTWFIDFEEDLLDLENDNDLEVLLSAHLENAWWRVIENNSDPGLSVMGTMEVQLQDTGQTEPTETFLSYQSQSIDAAMGDFQPVQLNTAGVEIINKAFDDWLDAKAQNDPLPSVNFKFTWYATVLPPEPPPNVDFTWEGKVRFTLVGLVTVDVPNF